MKTLVTGWFSFDLMGASAGDLLARDVVCGWLTEAGLDFDVALAPPFVGGVRWEEVDPQDYAQLVFVCGPFGNGEPVVELLRRFEDCRLVGVNLSMLQPLEEWNPFDLLLERDSSEQERPDISLLSSQPKAPVVGLVLIDEQPEYGENDLRSSANEAFNRLISVREMSVVPIDTRLDTNRTGLRTPAEVESLIARMDVVLTTRLHGLVLALKNGVPVIAIDSVAGGHKVSRQAKALGWPFAYAAEALEDQRLLDAFDHCLTAQARAEASDCAISARRVLEPVGETFKQESIQFAAETKPER
jgi:hypothetical protein